MKAAWLCWGISTLYVWATTPSATSPREPSEASRPYASCKYSPLNCHYQSPNDPHKQPPHYGLAPAGNKLRCATWEQWKLRCLILVLPLWYLIFRLPSFDSRKRELFIFRFDLDLHSYLFMRFVFYFYKVFMHHLHWGFCGNSLFFVSFLTLLLFVLGSFVLVPNKLGSESVQLCLTRDPSSLLDATNKDGAFLSSLIHLLHKKVQTGPKKEK